MSGKFSESPGHIHIKMGPDIYTGGGRYIRKALFFHGRFFLFFTATTAVGRAFFFHFRDVRFTCMKKKTKKKKPKKTTTGAPEGVDIDWSLTDFR